LLPMIIDQACEIIESFCALGIVRTMEQFNRVAETPVPRS